MKTWADFYDFCHADVSGVSTIAAERELRRAAQEFFEKTKCWKADLDPVYVFEKVDLYDVEAPKGSTIVKIAQAKDAGGRDVTLLTPGDHRTGILFLTQLQFQTIPMPVARTQIKLRAVLAPNHAALGIDDPLFDQYAEIIAGGAKARLFLQPQKPYTNPALAEVERSKFDLAIAREKVAAAKGFSGAALRTTPQFK